jgi:DNA-directed RNA polymerase subunit E'/Rpb7
MTSPYINTKLYTSVILYPHQMNNKIYLNLKKNLSDQVANRCFLSYGFIIKIIEIINYTSGIIEMENMESSAKFDVTFSCRLCAPLKEKTIICQIDRINKVLITAKNGPILVIITNDRINVDKFFIDNNNNFRFKVDANNSSLLEIKNYIKIKLVTIEFNNGDNTIKAIGFLEDIASEKEKQQFFKDTFDVENDELIDYDKYSQNNT